MLALVMTLLGFAVVESFNVLNLAVTSAIVYDSRLQRRSPLPGGLSFLAGLFAATTTVGITVVLGVTFFTELTAFEVTPTMRYRAELAVGVILIGLACYPSRIQKSSPRRNFAAIRRNAWALSGAGAVLGCGQAMTDVMYLAALTMISTHHPRPSIWPVIVMAYCAIALWPPLLVISLASMRSARARRVQRWLLRIITRYAPLAVRCLCLAAGVALVAHSLMHGRYLW